MMRHGAIAMTTAVLLLADVQGGAAQPFPSGGSPNPAMTGVPGATPVAPPPPAALPTIAAPAPSSPAPVPNPVSPPVAASPSAPVPASNIPRAVTVARATAIPRCTIFVDAAAGAGNGTAQSPHKTITAAVAAAANGAVICVAEGIYAEQLKPGEKYFTLAGGFQRGTNFTVRDSARFVSKAQGRGGSFVRYEDPGPKDGQLNVIDGFEISGYEQAIFRDIYYSQRFDVTNNYIHDNKCADLKLAGGGIAFGNVSGRISGNVFRNNTCGRGGAAFLNDDVKQNTMVIERNLVDNNHGMEPDASHGGAFYFFGKTLTITGNLFTNNSVTQWGGGLYVGAYPEGGNFTTATLSWNVYRGNKAGNGGGGFFCDDGATCGSDHEIFDGNCGSNIYLDSGAGGPTVARFDHLTNVNALDIDCKSPGAGVRIDKDGAAPDNYIFTNAIFWGNAPGRDFVVTGNTGSRPVKVTVSHSMVQSKHQTDGATVTVGAGNIPPADPLFADPQNGDFHLKSAAGRWTPAGYVQDAETSPAIAKGDPRGAVSLQNQDRAGNRSELGAYGNSAEASYVR